MLFKLVLDWSRILNAFYFQIRRIQLKVGSRNVSLIATNYFLFKNGEIVAQLNALQWQTFHVLD